ncbi:hypothetical protein EV356DRAFT_474489 [Viridothelium virens]|uniref:HTH psq-type domain-containing protein n=1 Tax=Viridothelium virens TaxID=1048519 RepID=A0A6A6GXC4_VIRVR|nr:hypothetical protein EV356DRAFT_474489 [Viridothelium virens]
MYDREAAMAAASADLDAGISLSINSAADAYGVPRTTLRRRLHGYQIRQKSHQHEQRLSPNQEDFLRDWILEEDTRGYPPSHACCCKMAS